MSKSNTPLTNASVLDFSPHGGATRTKFSTSIIAAIFVLATVLFVMTTGTSIAVGLLARSFFISLCGNSENILIQGLGVSVVYVFYGLTLVTITPVINRLLCIHIDPSRGDWKPKQVVAWYLHNAIHYWVRYTVLELILLTPLATFYLRGMGAKIGHNVAINTSAVSDLCLLEIEDNVFIGGSAAIMGHYSCTQYLNFAPVRICKNAAIGTRSIILGGTTIGEFAKVLPNSYVPPNTNIPAGEVWGGVPARKLSDRHLNHKF